MRFTIEQRHLTDVAGKPIQTSTLTFHVREAETVEDAVHLFITDADAEVIGNVLKFPGFQAMATVRDSSGVSTLQIAPTSEHRKPG
ncbi:MAG: hypothetical protein ABI837_03425 [Acidobacteriota bacterium]